jgi:plasmid stability protein
VTVLHVRNFPDELHHEAHVEAAIDRTSLRELVIEAVRREIERRRRERDKRGKR